MQNCRLRPGKKSPTLQQPAVSGVEDDTSVNPGCSACGCHWGAHLAFDTRGRGCSVIFGKMTGRYTFFKIEFDFAKKCGIMIVGYPTITKSHGGIQ